MYLSVLCLTSQDEGSPKYPWKDAENILRLTKSSKRKTF